MPPGGFFVPKPKGFIMRMLTLFLALSLTAIHTGNIFAQEAAPSKEAEELRPDDQPPSEKSDVPKTRTPRLLSERGTAEKIEAMKAERLELLTKVFDETERQYQDADASVDDLLQAEAAMTDADYAIRGTRAWYASRKRLNDLAETLSQDPTRTIDAMKVKAQYLKVYVDGLEAVQKYNGWAPFSRQ